MTQMSQVDLLNEYAPRRDADPFDVYRALRVVNPSPYTFHLNFPEAQVTGASPEVLVRVDGGRIEVRPIAGTRPRGATPEHEPTPPQPAQAPPPAPPPPTPPSTREMADLRELIESVERPPHHAIQAKFARCSQCHTHRPQRTTTNSRGVSIVAYFDLEGGDARVIVRELEVLAIALGDRVTVDVKLVSPDGVRMSTLAARAAEKRGKLWRMLELIAGGTDRSAATLERHARELSIDPRELAGAPDTPPVIDPNKVEPTPTRFDVDGVMISGPRALRDLRARVIERAAALR
jgi:hypothetical protein